VHLDGDPGVARLVGAEERDRPEAEGEQRQHEGEEQGGGAGRQAVRHQPDANPPDGRLQSGRPEGVSA
jgi:hypothetical protein